MTHSEQCTCSLCVFHREAVSWANPDSPKLTGRKATFQEVAQYCRSHPQEVEAIAEMLPAERQVWVGRQLAKDKESSNAVCPNG